MVSAQALDVVLGVFCSKLAIAFMLAPSALLFAELTLQDGPVRAFKRVTLQYLCLSPVFEAFKSKLMGAEFVKELTVGGGTYIPTGRGLAISPKPPHWLYQHYCVQAMRDGARVCFYLALSEAARSSDMKSWTTLVALGLPALSRAVRTSTTELGAPRVFSKCATLAATRPIRLVLG